MSAQNTIKQLKKALAEHLPGATDAERIEALADAFTPQELIALHKAAVEADRLTMDAAIFKAVMNPQVAGQSGTWKPDLGAAKRDIEDSPITKRKQAREDAALETLKQNVNKAREGRKGL